VQAGNIGWLANFFGLRLERRDNQGRRRRLSHLLHGKIADPAQATLRLKISAFAG